MAAALARGLIQKGQAAGRKLSAAPLTQEVRRLLSTGNRSLPPADLEAIVVEVIAATRRRRA